MKKIILILSFIILYAFTTGDSRSVYDIPHLAGALCSGDFDNDGDEDIIVSINYDFYTDWYGIYLLENDGKGNFSYLDSINFGGGTTISTKSIFNNEYPDIITKDANNLYVVSNNGNEYELQSFPMGERIYSFDLGDIDNDEDLDVVFCSPNNEYWGILYNQDKEGFSEPEYHYLGVTVHSASCNNLDDIGGEDVVLNGYQTKIYFYEESLVDSLYFDVPSLQVLTMDFDNDGDFDIISYTDIISVSIVNLFENKGGRNIDTICSFMVPEGLTDMISADFDNNGYNDIVFLPHSNNERYLLYYNMGDFIFEGPIDIPTEIFPYESVRHIYSSDFDNNGFPDIACTHRIGHIASSGILDIKFNDGNGNFVENPVESIEESECEKTTNFKNYPNPFITSTTFEFILEKTSNIEISVNNLNGELVKSINKKNMKRGEHTIKWDGLNNAYQACRPGPYIAYLKVNGTFMQSIKLIIN